MRLVIALVAVGAALVAPPQEDVARDVRSAFKQVRDFDESLPARRQALDLADKGWDPEDSGKVIRALLNARAQLQVEVAEFEERRRSHLERGTVPKDHERRRGEIDPTKALDERIAGLVAGVEDVAAADEAVLRALEDRKLPATVRVEAARAAKRASDEVLEDVARAVARARRTTQVCAALEASRAAGRRAAAWAPAIVERLDDKDSLVQLLAVRALAASRAGVALAPLIAKLEDDRFAVRNAAHVALLEMSGQRIGLSRPSWELWLEREGGAYVSGDEALPGPDKDAPRPQAGGPTYFGLPLQGDGLFFVLDRSLSMQRTMGKPSRKAKPGEVDRKRRAAEELCTALAALRPHQRFDIASFANASDRFRGELVPATEKNIAMAQAWVREEGLAFGTGIYDALELAFRVAGVVEEGDLVATAVDSVYLLTDGVPILPGGKGDNGAAIRRAARSWNVLDQVQVHVVGLGDQVPRPFLKGLASDTGGECSLRVEN